MVSASSSSPAITAWRRAASSEAVRSAFGLVDSTRVTARSTIRSSTRSPAPRWRIADWVIEPTILWTEESTTSAPLSSAAVGSATEKCRWAPHDSSTTSGTPRACATSASAGDVGDGAEVGRRDDHRRDRLGLVGERGVELRRGQAVGDARARGRSPGPRSAGAGPTARGRRSSTSGRCVARPPDLPRWARAMQIAWLPPEPPLTRNQLRRAPQASAASRCASCERRLERDRARCRSPRCRPASRA